jgi:hypothetical protein
MAQSGRRLTARPVESEQPGAEINYFQEQPFMRKQPKTKNHLDKLIGQSLYFIRLSFIRDILREV